MQVTFLNQRISLNGDTVYRYAVSNGTVVEVQVRTDRDGFLKYTPAQAKAEALRLAEVASAR